MHAQAIFDLVAPKVGDAAYEPTSAGTKDPFFKVKPDRWPEVARL